MSAFGTRFLPAARFGVIIAAGLLLVSACRPLTDATGDYRYGSVSVRASGSGSGPYTAIPTATFFNSFEQTLPNSNTLQDVCGTYFYSPATISPGNLEPGGPVPLSIRGSSVGMLDEPVGVPGVYVLPAPNSFQYVLGDTLRVNVPGAAGGFPAGQVSLRLAEPIQLAALTNVAPGDDFPISWANNGQGTSGVILALRFGVSATSLAPDRQVLCLVRDNGGYTIPGGILGEYYASPPDHRELNVLRWRTNSQQIDERSLLHIVSSLDTTVSLHND